jgi:hypothetical protein
MGLSDEEAGARKKALSTPLGSTTRATWRTRRPTLGLRRAAPEGGLTGEEPLARRPDSDDGRDEGGVQDPVDGRRLAEVPGEGSLDRATRAPGLVACG